MNAELDLILNQLSIYNRDFHKVSGIAETFHQAGLGEPDSYLKNLSSEGYIDQVPGTTDTYELSEKGRRMRDSGGFSHHAERTQEHRVAIMLTFLCALAVALFLLFWVGPRL